MITTGLLVAVIALMTKIVKEVLPVLSEEDQESLRGFSGNGRLHGVNRALRNAWDIHVAKYPQSHKRAAAIFLFVVSVLSVMLLPIWMALGQR